MRRILSTLTLIMILAPASTALANSGTARSTAAKATSSGEHAAARQAGDAPPRTRSLIFDVGSDIEGAGSSPDGEQVHGRQDVQHSSLIRLRTDFLPEIYKSVESLR